MQNTAQKAAKLSAAMIVALGFSNPAQAGLILGGSTLLTPSYVTDLEGWLGEGPLTLTNIFTTTEGSTAADFHTAVNGKGRTFTIIRATGDDVTAIVGGYNPQSWASSGGYNVTPSDADRTAFLFNLSNGTLHRQLLTGQGIDTGAAQTFDYNDYGPTFGSGHDLWLGCDTCGAYGVTGTFSVGYSYLYSYSAPDGTNVRTSLVSGAPFHDLNMQIGAVEVFSIDAQQDVPEPSTIALIGMALLSLFGFGMMRRRAEG